MVLVKNEEYWLPYVLKQTEGYFDSYVIYDVGSTDITRDIIAWWLERMEGKADIFVRYMPHAEPIVQGAFRNSMIVEGRRPFYFILDGDELYKPEDLAKISYATDDLYRRRRNDPKRRYGVFRRVEVTPDLTQQYAERRTHHRLYSNDAYWTGTHPGEVAGYKQSHKSEVEYGDIICWHMHNTLRSSKEEDALKRQARKKQKSYHPGEELVKLDLLGELPILRKPIENFPVTPALAELQEAIK
jgi:glycosyltransferase involved in cell wall biosynthesis